MRDLRRRRQAAVCKGEMMAANCLVAKQNTVLKVCTSIVLMLYIRTNKAARLDSQAGRLSVEISARKFVSSIHSPAHAA